MQLSLLPNLTNNTIINGPWLNNFFTSDGKIGRIIQENLIQSKHSQEYKLNFQLWEAELKKIYPTDEITPILFYNHFLLICAIITIFHLKQEQTKTHEKDISINGKEKLHTISNNNNAIFFNILDTFEILQIPPYFKWIFDIPEIIQQLNSFIIQYKNLKIISIDLFFELYQTLLFDNTRHQMGEFYTHSQLAEMMVKDSYKLNSYVLDPACGSGMFLLNISSYLQTMEISENERLQALNKICGIDRNPLACIMTRTNLLLHNFDLFMKFNWHPHIYDGNSLFISEKKIFSNIPDSSGFDLIIGNPPWVVLNRLSDKTEKEEIKQLGKELGILTGGKLATSTELTTSFIGRMVRDFLTPNGIIFFVTPASLATGAQHEKFRNFYFLQNVEFWAFDKDIFKIHNLCFKAQKTPIRFQENIEVDWKSYHCEVDPIRVTLYSTEKYVPQSVRLDLKNNERYIGRLGKKITNQTVENSFYRSKFRQGASLVPRNLLFVEIIEKKGDIMRIKPADTIQNKKYRTWEFDAYQYAEIESQYIFKVAKSTGIMPFHYEMSDWAFLPLNVQAHDLSVAAPKAAIHFHQLEKLYTANMKEGAEIQSFLKRLDYGHALSDIRQLEPFKIIYGGIGSIVKAAILRETLIIDTSLYYYLPKSEDEAYYLLGYLNSNLVTQYVKKVGSTGANGSLRNIHKHPLDLSFPAFNKQEINHLNLIHHSHVMEKMVNNFIQNEKNQARKTALSLKMIQKRLIADKNYQILLKKLDELVEKIITFSH